MTKILAFTGSTSPTSINHQLLLHIVSRITSYPIEVEDLRTLDIPIYNIVREKEGIPSEVKYLYEKIQDFPALIIAVNEYNNNVSGFFKNVLDWLSRVDRKFLQEKKIMIISTSPGRRGGAAALEYCKFQFPRFGGEVVESFSLPQFYENYDVEKDQVTNEVFEMGIVEVLTDFEQQIRS